MVLKRRRACPGIVVPVMFAQTAPTPTLQKSDKIRGLCLDAQLGASLHFFGSDSRNSSHGAQNAPFTSDTLFRSVTPGNDNSCVVHQTL